MTDKPTIATVLDEYLQNGYLFWIDEKTLKSTDSFVGSVVNFQRRLTDWGFHTSMNQNEPNIVTFYHNKGYYVRDSTDKRDKLVRRFLGNKLKQENRKLEKENALLKKEMYKKTLKLAELEKKIAELKKELED